MSSGDEGYLLRSQLSKLQLAVQNLNKENNCLKLENSLLLQHALPSPPKSYTHPSLAGPGHEVGLSPPQMQPLITNFAPGALPSFSGQAVVGYEMESALEEIRVLQHRLSVLRSKLQEPTVQQPPMQHSQRCPHSPDFHLRLVEELNSYRSRSPNHYFHASPNRWMARSPSKPCWKGPSAHPQSPNYGVSGSYTGSMPGIQHSPGAVRRTSTRRTSKGGTHNIQSPSRIPLSNTSNNGRKSSMAELSGNKRARDKSKQSAMRLHYGIPSKY